MTALFAAIMMLSVTMVGCGGDDKPAADTTTPPGDTTEPGDTTMGDTTETSFCEMYVDTCGDWGNTDVSCADWWAAAAPGNAGDTSGATQGCYLYHLDVAAGSTEQADIDAHCAHSIGGADAAGNAPCTDPEPPAGGACTNEADLGVLQTADYEYNGETYDTLESAAADMAQDCAFANIGAVLTGDCAPVSQCVADQAGLSTDCGGCYAGTVCCVAANCQMCVSAPDSEECGQCQIDAGCISDFYTCTGLVDE